MRKRKVYPKEFKESAMDLYQKNNQEKTAKDIADDLGISPENLGRWLRESSEAEEKGLKVFLGQGNPRDEELSRLRKENANLRGTNEILKKANVPKIRAIFTVRKPQ